MNQFDSIHAAFNFQILQEKQKMFQGGKNGCTKLNLLIFAYLNKTKGEFTAKNLFKRISLKAVVFVKRKQS